MVAYYNEFDPHAAAWLRELIKEGLIAPGDVDERSIEDVAPVDIRGYTQCHFFAGIGGWSYALRLAGWPDDRPVWSGSCPCQPFSSAGKGEGFDDERHLWPAWYWLIRQCRPGIVFGEQVSSKAGLAWFDLVSSDLEGAGYAVAAVDLCAASVGAPHIRQRLWFVADAEGRGQTSIPGGDCKTRPAQTHRNSSEPGHWTNCEWLPCRDGKARPTQPSLSPLAFRLPERVVRGSNQGAPINANDSTEARVMRLRGYGNSIVPQLAAEFIKAYLEASNGNAT